MLARSVTHALVGLEPRRVEVEAHIEGGVPGFAIVGLADRACGEAKHRVRSGIGSAQLEWPLKRITVNLAPAGLRKEGSGFDLSIALAVLAASRQIPVDRLAEHAAVGELALDGRVRPVRGAFAVAEGARRAGLAQILCGPESACEAELGGVEAIPVRHLAEAVAYLRGELRPPPAEPPAEVVEPDCPTWRTFGDRSAPAAHSSSPPRAATTCCWPARPERARRCWAGDWCRSCPRSSRARRSR